jgi:hypothetical protein
MVRRSRLSIGKAGGAVRHDALALRRANARAEICFRRLAEDAIRFFALYRTREHNVAAERQAMAAEHQAMGSMRIGLEYASQSLKRRFVRGV